MRVGDGFSDRDVACSFIFRRHFVERGPYRRFGWTIEVPNGGRSFDEFMGQITVERFPAAKHLERGRALPSNLKQESPGCGRRLHGGRTLFLQSAKKFRAIRGCFT